MRWRIRQVGAFYEYGKKKGGDFKKGPIDFSRILGIVLPVKL
jgi:hypothetical protein